MEYGGFTGVVQNNFIIPKELQFKNEEEMAKYYFNLKTNLRNKYEKK